MKNNTIIKPTIRVLDKDQKRKIHSDSLNILSSVGIRVESGQAKEVFKKAIGSKAVKNDIVRIPAEIIEAALKTVPSDLDIYDRKGEKCVHLPGEARFGLGVTTLYYQDPETDTLSPFSRKYFETCIRLGNRLPSFDFVCPPGILQDVPNDKADCYAALEMTANTTKPLVILVSKTDSLPMVLNLLEYLHGDLSSKPSIIPLMTPITPLFIDTGTFKKMIFSIERGLPFIYVSHALAGANAPITAYGSLALLNAEMLAGVTLSQLVHERTPMIAGYLNGFLDMRTMINFYDASSYLLNLACAEMMAFYKIPHYGNSGNAIGWGADLIASGHQWMNHILACIGTSGLAVFIGTVLASKAFSPKLTVYANEIIIQARSIAKGIEMDDGNSLLDEIVAVGPAGNFLSTDMTLKNFRRAYFESEIFPRVTMEDWQSLGNPKAESYLRKYTISLIKDLKIDDQNPAIIEKGEAFIYKNI